MENIPRTAEKSTLSRTKAYILCPQASANPLYSPWLEKPGSPPLEFVVVDNYDDHWTPPQDCGLVISHLHYTHPTAIILKRLHDANQIPILILADGILEYRNTFENPNIAAGSVFMPVQGHKIACIGDAQARIISGWGNPGKCETTGLPRLDNVVDLHRQSEFHPDHNEIRILVATAKQPAFTQRQMDTVRQSLVDVKKWFDSHPSFGSKAIQPIWRLTGGLDQVIGIDTEDASSTSTPFLDVLQNVDAVITTPSTAMLESWLLKRPTAVLDYTNSPRYVSPAWNINSSEQVPSVLRSLLAKKESRLLFQQQMLQDSLQIIEPATERLIQLIRLMIDHGNQALRENRSLNLPSNMLSPLDTPQLGESVSSIKKLFPDRKSFSINETEQLVTQLDHQSRSIQQLHSLLESRLSQLTIAQQTNRVSYRLQQQLSDQVNHMRAEIQRLQRSLRIKNRPTRLQRKLRINASMALEKWLFYISAAARQCKTQPGILLDNLFDVANISKNSRLPITIENHQQNKKRLPQVKVWKQRPRLSLLKKLRNSSPLANCRIRLARVTGTK